MTYAYRFFNVKLPPQIKRSIHHLILRFLFSIPLDFKFYAGDVVSQSRNHDLFSPPQAPDTWSWHRYRRRNLSGVFKKTPSNKVWLGLEVVAPNPLHLFLPKPRLILRTAILLKDTRMAVGSKRCLFCIFTRRGSGRASSHLNIDKAKAVLAYLRN